MVRGRKKYSFKMFGGKIYCCYPMGGWGCNNPTPAGLLFNTYRPTLKRVVPCYHFQIGPGKKVAKKSCFFYLGFITRLRPNLTSNKSDLIKFAHFFIYKYFIIVIISVCIIHTCTMTWLALCASLTTQIAHIWTDQDLLILWQTKKIRLKTPFLPFFWLLFLKKKKTNKT